MQQGCLCTTADPRRIGEEGGEPFIITPNELRDIITRQQTGNDETIWMTTAQAGFPLTRNEDEVTNSKDTQMGRTTTRYLHPAISKFITDWASAPTSSEEQPSPEGKRLIQSHKPGEGMVTDTHDRNQGNHY
jgi:hypothetical protein